MYHSKLNYANTIQYNTIPYNTIPYHTIQYPTLPYHTIQYNTIQYNTIQYNTIQYKTKQNKTKQYNGVWWDDLEEHTSRTETLVNAVTLTDVSIVTHLLYTIAVLDTICPWNRTTNFTYNYHSVPYYIWINISLKKTLPKKKSFLCCYFVKTK